MRNFTSKFTWNTDSPAPFESSWMIFAKIMALNYSKPHVVWDVITAHSSAERKGKRLLLHHSEWINFERFSDALGIKANRLKKGFLDQLGFAVSTTDIAAGIRFCPECLAKGYHCSYFNLSLIDACPWHGVKLLPACKECTKIIVSGLKREKSVEQHSYSNWSESGAGLIYKSECGHLRVIPQLSTSLHPLSEEEQSGINVACNLMLRWWYMINVSDHPYALFAQKLFSKRQSDEELKKCLAIANEIAGLCPWPLRLNHISTGRCEWRQTGGRESKVNNKEKEDYLLGIYKSVRRHIFRRCLRHHRDCVLFLLELDEYEAQHLISSTACSIALAYIWWRMVLEQNNLLPHFRRFGYSHSGINKDLSIGVNDSKLIRSPKSLAHLWFIQFFVILDSIERKIDKKSFDINRWELLSYGESNIASYEFVPDRNLSSSESSDGRWLALYPDADYLIGKGDQRCAFKFERRSFTEEMYTIRTVSLLKYRRARHVQFRIINLTEQRQNFLNSYAAFDGHFFGLENHQW